MDSRPSDESLLLAVAERDLVADAIQDTLVAVWQKPLGFRGGDIAAWLWGIAIRWLGTRGSVAAVFEKAEAVPAAEDQVLLSVAYRPSPDPLWWIVLARCAVAVASFGRWPKAAPVDVQSFMIPATSTARVGQQRRRRCSLNVHLCFADLLAAVGPLSTPVPAVRQVS